MFCGWMGAPTLSRVFGGYALQKSTGPHKTSLAPLLIVLYYNLNISTSELCDVTVGAD